MKSLKKLVILPLLLLGLMVSAQETANRFFYELSFKPKKDSAKIEKVMTTLDITKDKSLYRDFTLVAQDSILKVEVEAMQKAGVFKDISKSFKTPKFSEKIYKFYPEMKIQYMEKIANGFTPQNIAYNEDVKFNWSILSDKVKIGTYTTQKATTEFGGRKWTAWFSTDIPFQDGSYKFYGLPGLIVKIEDDGGNYSWELKGNKKIENFSDITYAETISGSGGKTLEMPREKFEKTFNEFKKDPFSSMRPLMNPEMMSKNIPGMNMTVADAVKKQEQAYKDFFNANDNPIEILKSLNK
ncbi:GLPGLI family protein [Epilithonimonas hominis]|uniref:GLPGLI family protein n=1 Tax=Epilithonimonas hominis TaxID=420404 RepID=UPI002898D5C5|nr:GLPGLI family protein [Epilithonimonas hominis]